MTSKATPTERNKTMPSKTDSLPHAEWCKAERVEATDYPDRGIITHHCLDCAAHEAKDRQGKTLRTPGRVGALVGEGRGGMDIDVRKARPSDVPGVAR